MKLATVVLSWRQPDKGRDLLAGEAAEFRQLRQHCKGSDRSHTLQPAQGPR